MPSIDDIPDARVKHDDWEVAVVTSLEVGDAFAAGGGVFSFRNGSYNDSVWGGLIYDMAFIGAGLGLTLDVFKSLKTQTWAGKGGRVGPALTKNWHKIQAARPFSAYDLGGGAGSSGRMVQLSVVAYRILLISAGNLGGNLFGGQSVSGFTLGAGGSILIGTWQYLF